MHCSTWSCEIDSFSWSYWKKHASFSVSHIHKSKATMASVYSIRCTSFVCMCYIREDGKCQLLSIERSLVFTSKMNAELLTCGLRNDTKQTKSYKSNRESSSKIISQKLKSNLVMKRVVFSWEKHWRCSHTLCQLNMIDISWLFPCLKGSDLLT